VSRFTEDVCDWSARCFAAIDCHVHSVLLFAVHVVMYIATVTIILESLTNFKEMEMSPDDLRSQLHASSILVNKRCISVLK